MRGDCIGDNEGVNLRDKQRDCSHSYITMDDGAWYCQICGHFPSLNECIRTGGHDGPWNGLPRENAFGFKCFKPIPSRTEHYSQDDASDPNIVEEKSFFKFNEDKLIDEALEYIKSTYEKHYSSSNGIQSIEHVFAAGHGEGFNLGNIIKLAGRFGKKDGKNRLDLLKIIHYAILTMYLLDEDEKQLQILN